MIKFAVALLGKHLFTVISFVLAGALMVQVNIIAEKSERIAGLQFAVSMLNSQLKQHERKAEIMDNLRRRMHKETVTLRDKLSERQQMGKESSDAIMLKPVSRDEYESLLWLRDSIKGLNFGSPP